MTKELLIRDAPSNNALQLNERRWQAGRRSQVNAVFDGT